MYSMFNGEDEILILAFPMLPMTWEKINVFLIMMSPISEYKDQNKCLFCLFVFSFNAKLFQIDIKG